MSDHTRGATYDALHPLRLAEEIERQHADDGAVYMPKAMWKVVTAALRSSVASETEATGVNMPADLHPATKQLVLRFAQALAEKLRAAEVKYGYDNGWTWDGWQDECRAKLYGHLHKGDPRDVAAFCAFMWHHGWSTAQPAPGSTDPRSIDYQGRTGREDG